METAPDDHSELLREKGLGKAMVYELMELGRLRYVGERAAKIVHDRWHRDCQGCGLTEIVRRGDAVGFEPDSLDGALYEGYEYCEACMDRSEPAPPKWAVLPSAGARDEDAGQQSPGRKRSGQKASMTG